MNSDLSFEQAVEYIKSLDVFAESIDWDRLNYKKVYVPKGNYKRNRKC